MGGTMMNGIMPAKTVIPTHRSPCTSAMSRAITARTVISAQVPESDSSIAVQRNPEVPMT